MKRLRPRLAVFVFATLAVLSAGTVAASPALAVTQLPMPGIPTTTHITSTSISFTWTASAGPVANYTILRSDGVDPYQAVGTTTGTTYTGTGLAPDTVYYHRVVANPTPGSGYTASDPSFSLFEITLPANDTTPPSTPTYGPVVSVTGPYGGIANTSGSTDDDRVAGSWLQLLTNGAWSDWVMGPYGSFILPTLTGNTTYTVAAVAFDRTGNRSARTAPVTFTTPPYAPAPTCKVQRQILGTTAVIMTFTIDNQTAATVLSNWTITFTMPAAQTLISPANLTHTGDKAILGPSATNAQIPPNTTSTFNLYDNLAGTPVPSGFTLNSPATAPVTCPATDRGN
jgi:hypothetical protein